MDLYNTILEKGGQILQDGSAWRQLASKDGSKIINQFATKEGNTFLQVLNTLNPAQILKQCSKTAKADGSFLSQVFDAVTGKGQIFAVQKLEKNNSFMSVLFKTTGATPPKTGEFLHCVAGEVQKKAPIMYNQVNKGIMPKNMLDNRLYTSTNIFNSKFGKIL